MRVVVRLTGWLAFWTMLLALGIGQLGMAVCCVLIMVGAIYSERTEKRA